MKFLKKSSFIAGSFIVATSALILSCATKEPDSPHVPTRAMADATGSDLALIGEGYTIYKRHCAQCHELKVPKSIPSKAWHVIVPGMAWNAGLSNAEEVKVYSYISAASKYSELKDTPVTRIR